MVSTRELKRTCRASAPQCSASGPTPTDARPRGCSEVASPGGTEVSRPITGDKSGVDSPEARGALLCTKGEDDPEAKSAYRRPQTKH